MPHPYNYDQTMEIDVDKVDGDKSFELEDSSETEEAPTHFATLDSVIREKLIDLSTPKASLSSTSIKSTCMEQMLLLRKMDVHI